MGVLSCFFIVKKQFLILNIKRLKHKEFTCPDFLGIGKLLFPFVFIGILNLHAPISWGLENRYSEKFKAKVAIYMPRFLGDWKTSPHSPAQDRRNLHAPISWGLENINSYFYVCVCLIYMPRFLGDWKTLLTSF